VADALFAARGLAQQLDDARESARIARESQRVAGILADRGLAAQGDAQATAANVAQADAAVTGLADQLQAARRSLLVLIGRGTDPVESLVITAAAGEPPLPPDSVPGDLLERRPDVREADKRLRVAIAQLEVDRINLFPKFTLTPGVGISRTSSNSFTGFNTSGAPTFGQVTQTIANWSLGVGVNVPILDRPRLLATLKASGARAEQAVIGYESAVQTAYGEAENALSGLKADRERLSLLDAGERAARAAYDAAGVRYNAGLIDVTTLLTAEQTWRAARSQATAARSQAMRRSVQAFKALGGGWSAGEDFNT
jgi:outer membrane protein TolC